jgi:hypothetical protein
MGKEIAVTKEAADVAENFTGRRSYAGRTTQDLLRWLNGRQFTGEDEC